MFAWLKKWFTGYLIRERVRIRKLAMRPVDGWEPIGSFGRSWIGFEENLDEVLHQVSLFDLLVIFNVIISKLPKEEKYELFQEQFHVKDEADIIREKLAKVKKIPFVLFMLA